MSLSEALGSEAVPASVAAFLEKHAEDPGSAVEEADSLKMMNNKITQAQLMADVTMMECQRSKEASADTLSHMRALLITLNQKRALLDAQVTQSTGAISSTVQRLQDTKERFVYQQVRFAEMQRTDREVLSLRERNLNASLHMLESMRCSFLQRSPGPAGSGGATVVLEACEDASAEGQLRLRLLNGSFGGGAASAEGQHAELLLQLLGEQARVEQLRELPKDAVLDTDKQAAKKCFHAQHGCGILRDTAGVLWSNEKEVVDQTRQSLYDNEWSFQDFKRRTEQEIESFQATIAEYEAQQRRATNASARVAKEQAELILNQAMMENMSHNKNQECEETTHKLLYDEICALRRVRDEIIREKYPDVDLADVTDCYVGDWVFDACSSLCDPNVPPEDEQEAGIQSFLDRSSSRAASGRQPDAATNGSNESAPNRSANRSVNVSVANTTANRSVNASANRSVDGVANGSIDPSLVPGLGQSGSVWYTRGPVGGNRTMRRDIIVRNSATGAPCPSLTMYYECNQRYCPSDCKVSEWGLWGECSANCGGGTRTRMRTITRKPRYGGQPCKPLQETQGCSIGACDRDCALADWGAFSPCSMPCDSGVRERRRGVATAAIGTGTCPGEADPQRVERDSCNANSCTDMQTCFGSHSVVLALDSSGSLTEEGFGAIQNLAAAVTEAFQADAQENWANVKLGLVVFGNGEIDKEGVMSDVEEVSSLSSDLAAVGEQISAQKWHAGVTNMAQGLVKAEKLLGITTGSTPNATQSTVVVITDGRPAFRGQVDKVGKQLRKFARLVVVQVQRFPMDENVDLLKGFVSEPSQTNYLLIRGSETLQADLNGFAKRVVARACQKDLHWGNRTGNRTVNSTSA